jgi:hypothetical protein
MRLGNRGPFFGKWPTNVGVFEQTFSYEMMFSLRIAIDQHPYTWVLDE